jgi:hypothetical protein
MAPHWEKQPGHGSLLERTFAPIPRDARYPRAQTFEWTKKMSAKNILDEHENRITAITAMAIKAKALILDESADGPNLADDPIAEKVVYANAFQAWADSQIEGTAEDIFETVQEVLEA